MYIKKNMLGDKKKSKYLKTNLHYIFFYILVPLKDEYESPNVSMGGSVS